MIQIDNVSFRYENSPEHSGLCGVNLHIKKGELVLLCGESGCGKTTLIRLINGLIPHYFEGEMSGVVLIDGKSAAQMPIHETAKLVGSVFQNPRSQFFNVNTDSELAFGCENQGLPVREITGRIQNTVAHLNIGNLMGRSIFNLSGGEKQKVACGCVHTASPEVIVLDEPSSNLDARATLDLAKTIAHWKDEGKTIVITEHRLYYLRELADRIVFMRDGKIDRELTPHEAEAFTDAERSSLGLRPLSLDTLVAVNETASATKERIELSDFHFHYKNGMHALNIDLLSLPKGGIIAVIGQNGAGKSTFARCLCGLGKGFKGSVTTDGKTRRGKALLKNAYMVMQDVNHQLFTENVLDEVLLSMPTDDTTKAEAILDNLNLLPLKERHPMSLSGGQKQRVAIASAIASERDIIVFDEPTSGLDLRHMEQVSVCLQMLRELGKTLIIVSHDLELILKTCDYVLHFESGKVMSHTFGTDINTVVSLLFTKAEGVR